MAMVSTIPYAHVTNRYLYGPRSFAYVARLVAVLALAAWFPQQTLAVLFSAYVAWGPVNLVRARRARRAPGGAAGAASAAGATGAGDATLPAP
jgi:phosphatidylserine synthase